MSEKTAAVDISLLECGVTWSASLRHWSAML
jgi:hypothetical protein